MTKNPVPRFAAPHLSRNDLLALLLRRSKHDGKSRCMTNCYRDGTALPFQSPSGMSDEDQRWNYDSKA
jgi:hypothetical protein